MEWISISEKTPEIGEKVLCFRPYAFELDDEEITMLEYEGVLRIDHKGNTYGFERCHFVSHWKRVKKPNQ